MIETYLDWYKSRMHEFVKPDAYSLVSSSVEEPWELLKEIHGSPASDDFEGRYWTPNSYGHPDLIRKIAEHYQVDFKNVLLTQGATSAIFLLCSTFLRAGDHAVVESPVYEPLFHSPLACDAKVDFLKRSSTTALTAEDIRAVVKPETKLMILTDLHNPLGMTMSGDELETIAMTSKAISPDIRIVVDEIYLDFLPDRRCPASMIDPVFISVSSLTKVYGFSILRCGWVFAEESDIERLRQRQVLLSGIGSRYLETLSLQVFENLDLIKRASHEQLDRNRPVFKETMTKLMTMGHITGRVSEHGCTSFLRITGVENTRKLTDFLEREHRMFCVPGEFFGSPDHIRFGIGEVTTEKLLIALKRFSEGLATFRSSAQ